MSVRAIRKKENQSRRSVKQQMPYFDQQSILSSSSNQINLKTRSKSHPNLSASHHDIRLPNSAHSKYSKSESELSKLKESVVGKQTFVNLINAKSETCLKTLSVHSTVMDRSAASHTTESTPNSSNQFRRMSQRSNASSNASPSESQNRGFADPHNIRIPIIGYEVMEERARFTVSFCHLVLLVKVMRT